MSTPSEEKNAFYIIKNWFLNSPSHGIRRISHANSIIGRLFWSTTFIVFTTLMVFFICTVIKNYIAYPTKISLSVRQYHDPDHFPAITFCNLNLLRSGKVLETFKSLPANSDIDNQNQILKHMDAQLTDNISDTIPTTIDSGYKLTDLLIKCSFNTKKCYQKNFTSFFHPKYGNCYTFNNDLHVEPTPQNSSLDFQSIDDDDVEDDYKLFLELFLFQNDSIPSINDGAAFRLLVHRKHEIPILSKNSLLLPPTTFTKLIFSQRIIQLSQHCRKDLTDDMKEIFNFDSTRYSQALCIKLCEFRFLQKLYECTDRLFLIYVQFFNPNHTIQINQTSSCSEERKCLANANCFNSKKHCPECLPECELIQYTIQSSYADYPNIRSAEKVIQRVKKHLKDTGYSTANLNSSACSNNRRGGLLDDIVAVEISASPYATEILTESPMYTWVDLISSIGGQTGLWIGVSLISFVEIAELLFLLFCHFIRKIYQSILNQWKNFYQRFLSRKK